MNESDWVGRWRSSAVTRGVWHGLCVCVCVYVHTNPATYVGTITDWIGGVVPAELSLHIQPPRVQRGGVGLGTCFCFPTGSMALAPTRILG